MNYNVSIVIQEMRVIIILIEQLLFSLKSALNMLNQYLDTHPHATLIWATAILAVLHPLVISWPMFKATPYYILQLYCFCTNFTSFCSVLWVLMTVFGCIGVLLFIYFKDYLTTFKTRILFVHFVIIYFYALMENTHFEDFY